MNIINLFLIILILYLIYKIFIQSEHFKDVVTIGSGEDCKLTIDAPEISYLHTTLLEVGGWRSLVYYRLRKYKRYYP